MLDRPRFWWRAVSRGTTSLNTWVSWFGLIVLVLGVAARITVPLVFNVSHWVTAVIITGAGLLVVAEGSYLEWKDADESRRKTKAVLEGVQAELEAARRPAVSPPPAVNPDEFRPRHAESGEFPDSKALTFGFDGGALAAWQVGSLAEARAAAEVGCDFIVVQGAEVGGHVRGQVSLLPLLDSVLDAVDVPVVAAGGIATARGVAAVLAAGAAGARLGTHFVATREAGAHPAYVEALLRASAADTVLTTAFSGMWPDAPHRLLRSCVEAAEAAPPTAPWHR